MTSLDARLQAALRGLDTSPAFEERLMARVRTESEAIAVERLERLQRLERARLTEQRRYGMARRQLRLVAFVQFVTLESVGITLLAGFGIRVAWAQFGAPVTELFHLYGPLILTGAGIALALAPLAVQLTGLRHRSGFAQ